MASKAASSVFSWSSLFFEQTMPALSEVSIPLSEAPAPAEESLRTASASGKAPVKTPGEDSLFADLPIPEAPLRKKRTRRTAPRAKGKPRAKKQKQGMLETDIKSEALALFQKGLTAQATARELILPLSAVSGWWAEYEKGTLLAKKTEASPQAPEEPSLF